MAELKPFRALHYNPQTVALSSVLAPPYDVISPEERDQLQASSPYNMIHLILGQSRIGSGVQADEAYARAGENWHSWQDSGVLTQDPQPAFYVYEQQFQLEGETYARTGLVASVKLEPYSSNVIFPHEKTFPGPKQDRLRLMETVNANLDSIFGLYDDRRADLSGILKAAKSEPAILSGKTPDGQTHKVWAIQDPETLEASRDAFSDVPIVIADGHHRYETALNYRDMRREAGDNSPALDEVMMTLCSIHDPGLLVLPTHRLVKGAEGETPVVRPGAAMGQVVSVSLSNAFQTEATGNASHTMDRLEAAARSGRRAYGGYFGEETGHLFTPKEGSFPSYEMITHFTKSILDRLPEVLEVEAIQVDFTHSSAEAVCQVNAGNTWIAFLLQGIPVEEVYEAARTGHLMPEKSTYFYPKLQSGLLMRSLY